MDIIFNSVRNVFFGIIVFIINIPIFWSFNGAYEFIKNAVKTFGIEI